MKIKHVVIVAIVLAVLLIGSTAVLAQERTHVVQPGENLFRIALRYGLTIEQLAAANGITNPAQIYAGQVLTIPGAGGSTGSTTSYTIVAGDTLFSIAQRNGTSVDTLVSLNGLDDADVLFVGQVILLPSSGAAAGGTGGPSTEQPTANERITYVVQAGETLNQIAIRFGTTYQQIALLNGLDNPNLIFAGQTLVIQEGTTPEPTEEATTATEEPTEEATTATEEPTEEATTATEEPTEEATTATEEPTEEATTATEEPTEEVDDDFVTPTPRVQSEATEEERVIVEVTPLVPEGAGIIPTEAADATEVPEVEPLSVDIPDDAPNLLVNAGFEGEVRAVTFPEIDIFEGWEPFYCDTPYTPEKCPAPRQGSGNPENLLMGRPEFRSTDIDNRVNSGGTAQHWWCFWRTCRAGVYQTVETTPGAVCEVGAYVQSWSANGGGLTSDLATQDQRDNSTWFIRVDTAGGTYAFNDTVLVSDGFGYEQGIYDQYVKISYVFTASGERTTVFFENLRLWPVVNNDNYIDDAYLRCGE